MDSQHCSRHGPYCTVDLNHQRKPQPDKSRSALSTEQELVKNIHLKNTIRQNTSWVISPRKCFICVVFNASWVIWLSRRPYVHVVLDASWVLLNLQEKLRCNAMLAPFILWFPINIIIRKVLWLLLLQDWLAEEESCEGDGTCSQRVSSFVPLFLPCKAGVLPVQKNITPAPPNVRLTPCIHRCQQALTKLVCSLALEYSCIM